MLDEWLLELKKEVGTTPLLHEYKVSELYYSCGPDPYDTREVHFSFSYQDNQIKNTTVYIPYNKPLTCEYVLSEVLVMLGLKIMELKYIKLSTDHVPGPHPVWGNVMAEIHPTGWIVTAVDSDFTCDNIPEWFKPIHSYCCNHEIDAIYFNIHHHKVDLFQTWDWLNEYNLHPKT